MKIPENRFKANLVLYGIITNIVAMINFFFGKLINLEVIKLTGFCWGMVFLGSLLGLTITKHIKETVFRRLILWLLVIMGLTTVVNAF